jgi:hypothetical protein
MHDPGAARPERGTRSRSPAAVLAVQAVTARTGVFADAEAVAAMIDELRAREQAYTLAALPYMATPHEAVAAAKMGCALAAAAAALTDALVIASVWQDDEAAAAVLRRRSEPS